MTRPAAISFGVRKEIRALVFPWLACAAAIGGAAVVGGSGPYRAALLVYVLVSAALGALSIGHEYTSRTLAVLLSLPADRRHLYLVKLGVLIPMLLTLGALALTFLFRPRALDPGLAGSATIPLLSLMCGVFLAPWLTMICRSPLAGAVFAIVLAGMMHLAAAVVGVVTYGFAGAGTPEAERLAVAVFWWGMTALCAIAAVSSWRMFMRLEAIEADDAHVRLPRWLRDRTAAAPGAERAYHGHPLGLLVKKELRLQQMTIAVSGIYLLEWGTLWWLRHFAPGLMSPPLAVLTVFHSGAIAVLSGSLASAEERRFGTLESQVLLPMATWTQWIVKAGTAVGLAVLLGVGLPGVLAYIDPSVDAIHVNAWYAGAVVLFTVGSLYVSSLCASGLRALLVSIPIIVGVPLTLNFLGSLLGNRSVHSVLTAKQSTLLRSSTGALAIGLTAGFVALALWFALVNHRSSKPSDAHVWRQVIWMAAWVMCGIVILSP